MLAACFLVVLLLPQFNFAKCPRGYELYEKTKSCYFIPRNALNFVEASDYCRKKRNQNLVTIHSAEENEFVKQLCQKTGANDEFFWTGLMYVEDKWQWLDMSRNEYTNWGKGMPVDSSQNRGAMIQSVDGTWENANYSEQRQFVCKKPMWM